MSKKNIAHPQQSSTKLIMDYSKDPYEQALLLTLLPRLYSNETLKKMLALPPQTDAIQEWIKQRAQQAKETYQKDVQKVLSKYQQNMEALLIEATTAAIKK